jgi:hypothetical protein
LLPLVVRSMVTSLAMQVLQTTAVRWGLLFSSNLQFILISALSYFRIIVMAS